MIQGCFLNHPFLLQLYTARAGNLSSVHQIQLLGLQFVALRYTNSDVSLVTVFYQSATMLHSDLVLPYCRATFQVVKIPSFCAERTDRSRSAYQYSRLMVFAVLITDRRPTCSSQTFTDCTVRVPCSYHFHHGCQSRALIFYPTSLLSVPLHYHMLFMVTVISGTNNRVPCSLILFDMTFINRRALIEFRSDSVPVSKVES